MSASGPSFLRRIARASSSVATIGEAVFEDPALPGYAHLARGRAPPGSSGLCERGLLSTAQGREEVRHALAVFRCKQKMQAQRLVRVLGHALLQGLVLIDEELVGQLRIAHRIVACRRAQLVVLHQPVIRVLREGDGREFERVDQWQAVERELRMQCRQRRLIERNDVMAKHEGGAFGERIQPANEIRRLARELQPRIEIGAKNAQLAQDLAVLASGFNVEAQAPRPRRSGRTSHEEVIR